MFDKLFKNFDSLQFFNPKFIELLTNSIEKIKEEDNKPLKEECKCKFSAGIKNGVDDNTVEIDVTTKEGLEKAHKCVEEFREYMNKFKDSNYFYLFDKELFDNIDNQLDEFLQAAEKKYIEAHCNSKANVEEKLNKRPLSKISISEADKVFDVVDKYINDEIKPRLSEDTKPELISAIREPLADFAAWIIHTNI